MEVKVKMPGLIRFYTVAQGDSVQAGQQLAVMEALRVQHQLLSPADGIVTSILVPAKQRIAAGTVIMLID